MKGKKPLTLAKKNGWGGRIRNSADMFLMSCAELLRIAIRLDI